MARPKKPVVGLGEDREALMRMRRLDDGKRSARQLAEMVIDEGLVVVGSRQRDSVIQRLARAYMKRVKGPATDEIMAIIDRFREFLDRK